MTEDQTDRIRVLYADAASLGPRWEPRAAKETSRVLKRTFGSDSAPEALAVKEEAGVTLGNCLPPSARNESTTGLAIGYVQSGKTLAFTVVSALARDSGFGLIVILAGTIKNLFEQSTDRLRRDLGVGEGRGWRLFTSDDLKNSTATEQVAGYLGDWMEEGPWVQRETVVITVLKHQNHLDRVADLLELLSKRGVLRELGAIVIDDEADQAGLNTLVGRGDESATYRRILRLRRALPQHTYLQYTATPQAILLISLLDRLSPSFVQILTPGGSYTGGKRFFTSELELVREIPDQDLQLLDDLSEHPPRSLVEALQTFLLVAAIGAMDEDVEHRSMMVHPHRLTAYHAHCTAQIRVLLDRWSAEMSLPDDHPDRLSLDASFKRCYDDLRSTSEEMPDWDVVRQAAAYVVSKVAVHELNSRARRGSTAAVDWDHERFTVLVGGQKLDRGYTVRGLAVTYMPRSRGVGNVDTIQQRARWFGYKEDYLGLCRVHLRSDVVRVYTTYIEHEESVRKELARVVRARGSIRDWRRAFFLDRGLRPTRTSVIGRRLLRGGRSPWTVTETPPRTADAVLHNQRIIDAVQSGLRGPGLRPINPTEKWKHRVLEGVPLARAMESILVEWSVSDRIDSARLSAVNLQFGRLLETHPDSTLSVFIMRPHLVAAGGSKRNCSADGTIDNVLEGRRSNYPGDRRVCGPEEIVLQLHSVRMVTGDGRELGRNVPVLAVHVPAAVSKDWLAEVRD